MNMDNDTAPHVSVNAQYIKDLSFESPNAPSILSKLDEQPAINLHLDLNISRMPEENFFEVEIAIEAEATIQDKKMFLIDLKYAGIFNMINIPEEQLELILAIHCPAILFPFARKIIADVTQDGGFQPLMMDPIDFGVLYSKKKQEEKESGADA